MRFLTIPKEFEVIEFEDQNELDEFLQHLKDLHAPYFVAKDATEKHLALVWYGRIFYLVVRGEGGGEA